MPVGIGKVTEDVLFQRNISGHNAAFQMAH